MRGKVDARDERDDDASATKAGIISRIDPRLVVPGMEVLAKSDALIVNIDYPLVQYNTQVQRLMRDHFSDIADFCKKARLKNIRCIL